MSGHDSQCEAVYLPICRCTERALRSRLAEYEARDGQRTREHNLLVRENREQAARLAEAEALRKDAERWRWALVHGFPFMSLDRFMSLDSHNYCRDVWVHGMHQGLTANAAIDAAMEESRE